MARNFNGSTDVLVTSLGALGFAWFGTMAAIVKKSTDGAGQQIFEAGASSTNRYGIYFNSSNQVAIRANVDRNSTTTVTTSDNWVLVAATKATGNNTPRFHIWKQASASMVHEPGSGSTADSNTPATRGQIGRNQGSTTFFNGEILAVGVWNVAFSDAQCEALAAHWTAWYVPAQPKALWILDQDATTQNVPDLSGNGAGQSSLTGTAVSTVSPVFPYTYGALPIISKVVQAAAPPSTWLAPSQAMIGVGA